MPNLVGILVGSKSDLPVAEEATAALEQFDIPYHLDVCSAHRAPQATAEYAATAEQRGVQVIIAMAGWAAHLPGAVAARTVLPVIGVPLATSALQGQDALYATVQMPSGVPVATVGVNAAKNAALLAAQILAGSDEALRERLRAYKASLAEGAPQSVARSEAESR
ncbi:MAG: 5-(carboxyamino)imidazole ribonucleotide mutase [Armatimonadota bacterium]